MNVWSNNNNKKLNTFHFNQTIADQSRVESEKELYFDWHVNK